jgi:hypothetical protein
MNNKNEWALIRGLKKSCSGVKYFGWMITSTMLSLICHFELSEKSAYKRFLPSVGMTVRR